MAYFKNSGTTSRGTDKLRNLDVELTKPEQVEQRIANTVIQDKLEVKTSPLGRLTSYKTSVTYYKIKTTNRNDFIFLNLCGNAFRPHMKNRLYNKIKFYSLKMMF